MQTTVDVSAIERELRQLWKSDDAGGKPATTRACTLNLVAYAPNEQRANRMAETVLGVTASSPNRAVVVISDPHAGESAFDAWVQANCILTSPGRPQVCGEQITVQAKGPASAHVPSLILSLLLPDLPLLLWLPGNAPFQNPLFRRLRSYADRILVDSSDFADPLPDLVELAERNAEALAKHASYGIGDMNWDRLGPWRELVAQFFDTRPLLTHLRRLDRVEVAYAADERSHSNPIRALLLVGWLVSALDWQLEGVGEDGALHLRRPAVNTVEGDTRQVRVVLKPTPSSDLDPGTLMGIHLLATDHTIARFSVERTDDDSDCARTIALVDEHPAITRIARMDRSRESDLLGAEARNFGKDRVFAAALAQAGQFAQALLDLVR